MKEALNFLLTGGIFINLINLGIYYKKREKALHDKILLAIFFVLTLAVGNYYAQLHGFDWLTLLTFIPNEMAEWIISPLLYLYIVGVIRGSEAVEKRFLKLFIFPSIILVFVTIPFTVYLLFPEWKLPHIEFLFNHSYWYVFTSSCFNLITLGYCLAFILSVETDQDIYYSSKRTQDYKWIKYFITTLIFIFILDVALELYELFIHELVWDMSYLLISVLVLSLYYLSYFGIHRSKILLPDFVWETPRGTTDRDDDLEAEKALLDSMKQQRYFLMPELTLSELAIRIGVSDKKLSELLNKQMNTNFYEFINEYRLQHFEELALSSELDNKTIFALAQESGFRSKATFNRLFKKKHLITPNEFIKTRRQ